MKPVCSWFFCAGGLLLLSGCAMNVVRLESADQVSLSANAVVAQSNAALDAISRRRLQALQMLIASDPSCPATREIYIFVPIGPPVPGATLPPLCALGKDDTRPGYRTKQLCFDRVGADRLKPTVLMIAAITEYGAAYRTIVAKPKIDVSAILASAAQKAADAKAIADAVLPDAVPAVPDLETRQARSAEALVQFLVDLADEARRARDVSKVYETASPKIDAMLDELDAQLADWTRATTLAYAEIETSALRRAYVNGRDKLTFEGRRAFVELIQKSEFEQNGVRRTANLLSEAIGELSKANSALGDLLAGKPTAEQRARAARINEDRIIRALRLSVAAATSWGMV